MHGSREISLTCHPYIEHLLTLIDDDTKIVKSRVSGISRVKLEAGRNGLGLCIARHESKSCCCVLLEHLLTP